MLKPTFTLKPNADLTQCHRRRPLWRSFCQLHPGDRGLPVSGVGGLCYAAARMLILRTLHRPTARLL